MPSLVLNFLNLRYLSDPDGILRPFIAVRTLWIDYLRLPSIPGENGTLALHRGNAGLPQDQGILPCLQDLCVVARGFFDADPRVIDWLARNLKPGGLTRLRLAVRWLDSHIDLYLPAQMWRKPGVPGGGIGPTVYTNIHYASFRTSATAVPEPFRGDLRTLTPTHRYRRRTLLRTPSIAPDPAFLRSKWPERLVRYPPHPSGPPALHHRRGAAGAASHVRQGDTAREVPCRRRAPVSCVEGASEGLSRAPACQN